MVRVKADRETTVAAGDVLPACPAAEDAATDLADLSSLNEATVLHLLQTRYAKDAIYVSVTWTWPLCACEAPLT